MPTGYTADVQDGKVTTLREFALQCSRAFGALIMMRDSPQGTPIPKSFEPETKYHDEHLVSANAILADVPLMTAGECDMRAAVEFEKAVVSNVEYLASNERSRLRYQEMHRRVREWSVPEDLAGLRNFMLEQLESSIKFDCGDYKPEEPVRLTGEKWREATLAKASHDVSYHSLERQKEIDRCAERNRWLDALWKSLPEEVLS